MPEAMLGKCHKVNGFLSIAGWARKFGNEIDDGRCHWLDCCPDHLPVQVDPTLRLVLTGSIGFVLFISVKRAGTLAGSCRFGQ